METCKSVLLPWQIAREALNCNGEGSLGRRQKDREGKRERNRRRLCLLPCTTTHGVDNTPRRRRQHWRRLLVQMNWIKTASHHRVSLSDDYSVLYRHHLTFLNSKPSLASHLHSPPPCLLVFILPCLPYILIAFLILPTDEKLFGSLTTVDLF